MHYLIWDFDGTPGYRDGGAWTTSLLEVLGRAVPSHTLTLEHLRPFTRSGFPWLEPGNPHPHLTSAGDWWASLLSKYGGLLSAFRNEY